MILQMTAIAYFDYLRQLSQLIRDPLSYGVGVPRGDGHPVLLIPGFTAGDWSLGTMARWLGRIGYRPYLSGIDLNVGCPKRKLEMLGWRVEKIASDSNDSVTVIGHSLGGVLARAIGTTKPKAVRRTIALGSPIREGWNAVHERVRPALQTIQSFWQTFSGAPDNCGNFDCSCGFAQAVYAAARRPFSSIYTRHDEVVQWESCIDEAGENYEVSGRHASLIVNPEVYRLVASILASQAAESAAA